MDEYDRVIVNALQDGLPLTEEPFARLAQTLEIDQQAIVARIANLLDEGILTRFGPMYNAERMGGALSLCAHNYEREHALNMWFVLATDNADRIEQVVAEIESETGCRVLQFPKQEEFFVGLKLEI